MKKLKYWYFRYLGECPVCGRDASYRERRLSPKPTDDRKTYEWLSNTITYDGCEL